VSNRFLIGITTFKRPDMLFSLLSSLGREVATDCCPVLVVDNDNCRSGYPSVLAARAAGMMVNYEVECQAGVVYGRNRILRAASQYEAVVCLDDDERVEPGWFDGLVRMRELNPSAVVTGPVIYQLPENVASWVREGGYFDRPNWPDGHLLDGTGTGNTLIPVSALESLKRPWFDPDFARTGGEDTEFFERLRAAGVRIVWSREARVVESVPIDRTTWRALTGRWIRSGNIRGRLTLRVRSRVHVLAGGAVRVVVGGAAWAARLVTGRKSRAQDVQTFFAGIGHIQAVVGKRIEVYGER
jgi:GT2 family glycosyltransferase